jgi:HSP20 family protein
MTLIKRHVRGAPGFSGFFDDFWNRDFANWGLNSYHSPSSTMPAVNIVESNDNYLVEVAAPGMTKDDFKIELDNDMLTISSEMETTSEPTNGDRYHRQEYSYQSFTRSFHLPKTDIDDNKIKAEYQNGILRINIPKKETAKAQAPRMININ